MLGACRHENLLPLGGSSDRGAGQQGEGMCVVTPLMNGHLRFLSLHTLSLML